jgi:putative membrane protein
MAQRERDPGEHGIPVRPGAAAHTETHLSWLRTRFSTERTLMSWVRTSTVMIAFGFTIFQFFDKLHEAPGLARPLLPDAPHVVSLSLIGIGVFGLILAIGDYRRMVAYLWSFEFKDFAGMAKAPRRTPVLSVAVLLTLVGVYTLVSLIIRLVR